MNKQCIIVKLKNKDGVSIIHPAGASVQDCMARAKKDYGDNIESLKVIDKDKLPKDRYFRDAWKPCDKKGIKEDLKKCRDIHMDNLRIERNKKLEKLDKEALLALEVEDKRKLMDIKIKKQELRHMPEHCDLDKCKSPKTIKEYVPEVLKD